VQESVGVVTEIDNFFFFAVSKSEAKEFQVLSLLPVTDIWSYYTFLQIKKVSIRHVKSFLALGHFE